MKAASVARALACAAALGTASSSQTCEACAAPVSFRDYDVAALRSLSSSLLVAAGSAWALHLAGVTTTLLLLQCALLPLACFDAEVVSLHLFQLPEGRPELQRPWPSETEKAEAALAELRAVFAA